MKESNVFKLWNGMLLSEIYFSLWHDTKIIVWNKRIESIIEDSSSGPGYAFKSCLTSPPGYVVGANRSEHVEANKLYVRKWFFSSVGYGLVQKGCRRLIRPLEDPTEAAKRYLHFFQRRRRPKHTYSTLHCKTLDWRRTNLSSSTLADSSGCQISWKALTTSFWRLRRCAHPYSSYSVATMLEIWTAMRVSVPTRELFEKLLFSELV